MASTRSTLYRLARILGDVEAAKKGPTSYARRVGRRTVYRQTSKLAGRITRQLGL